MVSNEAEVTNLDHQVDPGGFLVQIGGLALSDSGFRSDILVSPYLVFCSPNLFNHKQVGYNPRKGAAQTTVLKHRTVGEWAEPAVIALPPKFETADALAPFHVVIAVWDNESVGHHSLGQGNLPLASAAAQFQLLARGLDRADVLSLHSQPHTFSIPVLQYGKQSGVVSGWVQILGPKCNAAVAAGSCKALVGATGGSKMARPVVPRVGACCSAM